MKKQIYLDLDDTLADTTKKVTQDFNVDSFSIHNKGLILKNLYSVFKVWNRIKNNHEFWETIPLKKDALTIYEKSLKITSEIHILTALPTFFYSKDTAHFNLAAQAKRNWVNSHFPNIPQENIHVVYAKEKHLMIGANPTRYILVDDSPKNISNWTNAGGVGILVEPNSEKHLFKLTALIH